MVDDGTMTTTQDAARYRENLQGELDGAAIYQAMAEGAQEPQLRELYGKLADAERRHASLWQERLRVAGETSIPTSPAWRARVLVRLAHRFGPGLIVSTVAAHELADRGMYDDQPEAAGSSLPADERSHARLLAEMSGPGGVPGGTLARFEGRHQAVGGNALRAAVLGLNDGLVSNFSLVMGVAGAGASGSVTLIAGIAGLLAGSFSMALGEWLSVQSARELHGRQIGIEAEELRLFPEEEEEELRLIYEAKGVPVEQAREMAARVVNGELQTALDTLSREELGIDPNELGGSAWVAASTSFLLFSVGAVVPVIPFLFGAGAMAIVASAVLSASALFLVGAAITVITGQPAVRSGLRQLAFGVAAATLTFIIGRLLGTALS
jgi:VIT1/CCC1 family predicted Fe2+/Mn2+ transporter